MITPLPCAGKVSPPAEVARLRRTLAKRQWDLRVPLALFRTNLLHTETLGVLDCAAYLDPRPGRTRDVLPLCLFAFIAVILHLPPSFYSPFLTYLISCQIINYTSFANVADSLWLNRAQKSEHSQHWMTSNPEHCSNYCLNSAFVSWGSTHPDLSSLSYWVKLRTRTRVIKSKSSSTSV